jgi:hypothetical protein
MTQERLNQTGRTSGVDMEKLWRKYQKYGGDSMPEHVGNQQETVNMEMVYSDEDEDDEVNRWKR